MYDIYVVESGDTIDSIARKFNITPDNLYKLNGFDSNYNLEIGSSIIVPKMQNSYFNYYTVRKGDNLYQIARTYNVNEDLLAELNGLDKEDYIYPNQVIVVPKPGVNVYITKERDTLMGVVNGIGANIATLLYENPNIFLLPDQILVYNENMRENI